MKIRSWVLILAVLALCVPAVQAQEVGEKDFELTLGYLVPGIDDLDNDLTYGISFGGRPADQFGWNVYFGYMDLNQNNVEPLDAFVGNANGYFGDVSAIWYIAGSDFGLFGGLGFGSVDVDLVGTTTDVSDDSLTYNYGAFYAWNFGDQFLLKPQVKWRKWDGDTYEKTDEEYSVSFGWRF